MKKESGVSGDGEEDDPGYLSDSDDEVVYDGNSDPSNENVLDNNGAVDSASGGDNSTKKNKQYSYYDFLSKIVKTDEEQLEPKRYDMLCPNCGNIERRKFALDYGKETI